MAGVSQLAVCATAIALGGIFDIAAAQQRGATEEMPPEILAVQLRRQGHRCDAPVTAVRDARRSKPDEVAWILKCANASYRMRLVPDMAAAIEKLD